jgi:hypothetical protein
MDLDNLDNLDNLVIKREETTSNNFLASENNHVAVCIGVWRLGKRKRVFKGEEKIQHQVMLMWEVDEEMETGEYKGKNKTVNLTTTYSFNSLSRLSKIIEAWRGKLTPEELKGGFDLNILVGLPCMLNVLHTESNGKTYANVDTVTKLPAGMKAFDPDNLYINETPEFIEKFRQNNAETLK